jgi:hydrogenase-1 operon protein HyaF
MPIAPSEDVPIALGGKALPVLHEIRHALEHLVATGEPTVIDLGAMPLEQADEARLFEVLGEGEVNAEVLAAGRSSVSETAYHGVWRITHRNDHDEVLSRFIEIGFVPEFLKSQFEDVAGSAASLGRRLGHDGCR